MNSDLQGCAMRRLRSLAFGLVALFALQGCATYDPVTVFHRLEGGNPASKPPPAPGLNLPPPNLASVPPKPPAISPAEQAAVLHRLQAANRHQNAIGAPLATARPAAIAHPSAPPLLIGFRPGSAIVGFRDTNALRRLAATRGPARIAAIGFAPSRTAADLQLAIRRATAIADVLTAAGVPAGTIRLEALTQGRGGAAQLLYASDSQ